MGPGDAIATGFADLHIARDHWGGLISDLEKTGDISALEGKAHADNATPLMQNITQVNDLFTGDLEAIRAALTAAEGDFAASAAKAVGRNSPLAMACTLEMLARLDGVTDLREALRSSTTDEELAERIRGTWTLRTDRYSEIRTLETERPRKKIEMYHIGG